MSSKNGVKTVPRDTDRAAIAVTLTPVFAAGRAPSLADTPALHRPNHAESGLYPSLVASGQSHLDSTGDRYRG